MMDPPPFPHQTLRRGRKCARVLSLLLSLASSVKSREDMSREVSCVRRGRYLEGLHAAYEEFIADIARVIPVIKVNYSQFRTAEEMAEKIAAE